MDARRNSEELSPRNGIAETHGEGVPSWKKQIQQTKLNKEKAKRAEMMEEERQRLARELPEWKKAIIIKREELMMTSDDPYMVCKRRIKILEKECNEAHLPPWKKEVLQRKLQKLKEELTSLEEERIKAKVQTR